MEFSNNKPIFKQIVDYCLRCIVSTQWLAGSRIPSTKDLAVTLAVNNRTVIKAYDDLAAAGVIYQKRGLGYYVCDDAMAVVLNELRRRFYEEVIPEFISQMHLAELSTLDVMPRLEAADKARRAKNPIYKDII